MREMRTIFMCVALASVVHCGGGDEDLASPTDYNDAKACNPLGTASCLAPWPSSVYLDEDSSTATGYRLSIPEGAMPKNIDGIVVDPTPWGQYDGFGPTGVIIAAFPSGVSAAGLPFENDIDSSLDPSAPIVLLNMETGERTAFFAEVDMNSDDLEEHSLLIRPMVRMAPGTRYAVAIRNTVKAADGSELERPPGFQALVDGKSYNHPLFSKIEPLYDDIFSALETAGVGRDELVLAWDFVTASDEMLTRDLLTMRDLSLPAIGEAGANLTYDIHEESTRPDYVRNLYVGTHTAPNFLTNGEADRSRIIRDADFKPVLDGEYTAHWAAIIPKCMDEAPLPRPVMVFGHGLFGTGEGYLDDSLLQRVAQDNCVVVVAGDFIGLSERQIALSAFASNDANLIWDLTEKLAQSVINFIALENLVRGPLQADARFQVDGQSMLDANQVFYFGASLGGIMGNVVMAYDPTMLRGALGVPGGAWSLLIERSFAWTALRVTMDGAYEDQYVYQMLVAMLGFSFERYDPITTAGRVIHDPMPGTPAKQLLVYEVLNDSLVSNTATEFVSRELGIDVVGPTIREPWNMTVNMEGSLRNGLSIYTENATPAPEPGNVSPDHDNGTHADIHEYSAVLQQVGEFILNGEINNHCVQDELLVACDCTTGACGTK